MSEPKGALEGVPMEIRMRAVEARLKELELKVGAGKTTTQPLIASDEDLDSQYGNPKVYSDPKRWEGPSMKDRLYSECPPEFLDILAGSLEWLAGQLEKEGKPNAGYKRKDASRARGWAKRLRAGYSSQQLTKQHSLPDFGGLDAEDDDEPFK